MTYEAKLIEEMKLLKMKFWPSWMLMTNRQQRISELAHSQHTHTGKKNLSRRAKSGLYFVFFTPSFVFHHWCRGRRHNTNQSWQSARRERFFLPGCLRYECVWVILCAVTYKSWSRRMKLALEVCHHRQPAWAFLGLLICNRFLRLGACTNMLWGKVPKFLKSLALVRSDCWFPRVQSRPDPSLTQLEVNRPNPDPSLKRAIMPCPRVWSSSVVWA